MDSIPMIRAFLLLIALNTVCIGSYLIYIRMDNRINSSEESIKREMIEANQEMEKTLKNKILNGGEPDELISFRESWLLRIQDIKFLRNQKKHIENSLLSIIIPLLLSFKFALIEFFYMDKIAYWNGYFIYPSHIGWIFLLIASFTIIRVFMNKKNYLNLVNSTRFNYIYTIADHTNLEPESVTTNENPNLYTQLHENATINEDL